MHFFLKSFLVLATLAILFGIPAASAASDETGTIHPSMPTGIIHSSTDEAPAKLDLSGLNRISASGSKTKPSKSSVAKKSKKRHAKKSKKRGSKKITKKS